MQAGCREFAGSPYLDQEMDQWKMNADDVQKGASAFGGRLQPVAFLVRHPPGSCSATMLPSDPGQPSKCETATDVPQLADFFPAPV